MSIFYFLKRGTRKVRIAACAGLLIVAALVTGFVTVHQVKVIADGKTVEIRTLHEAPELILQSAGVKLGSKDEFKVNITGKTSREIVVYRAVPVIVEHEGKETQIITAKPVVGELLDELGYGQEKYQSDPGADMKIRKDLYISVFDKTRADRISVNEAHHYVETSRGALRYTRKLVMEATAYLPTDGNGEGITAMGIEARHGIVAVDPDVIPLGTRLYIPGYGLALAADTGGAIEGDTIDLCMLSYDEAMEFGRRDVEVYVLEG